MYLGLDGAVRHRLVSQTILGCMSDYFLVVRDAVCLYLKKITYLRCVVLHVGEVEDVTSKFPLDSAYFMFMSSQEALNSKIIFLSAFVCSGEKWF